jgi:hypothetical protein
MNGRWTKLVERLSLLVDEAQANRVMEAARVEMARARVDLYAQEQRHMCLTPGCRNPVVGEFIFAHCEDHIDSHESRWMEDKIESLPQAFRAKVVSTDPISKLLQDSTAEAEEAHAKENASKKMSALRAAFDLLDKARSYEAERQAFLPPKLLQRIDAARSIANDELLS